MTEPVNDTASRPPVSVPDGGNGPTEADEEALLAAKFGEPEGGLYGVVVE